jgi:hypothetical protein
MLAALPDFRVPAAAAKPVRAIATGRFPRQRPNMLSGSHRPYYQNEAIQRW